MAILTDEQQAKVVEAILAGQVQCRVCLSPTPPTHCTRVRPDDPDLAAPRRPYATHEVVDFHMCELCWDSWGNWEKGGANYWKAWKKHRKQQVGRFD